MDDLTLVYYTANTIRDDFAEKVRINLMNVTKGEIPIISVSQKPVNFGTNICIGEVGRTPYNCYKQIFLGAKEVKTEYMACVEDDTLYNMEHFSYRPKNAFAYNTNLWFIEEKKFWCKGEGLMCTCIAPTRMMVEILSARFRKFPVEDNAGTKNWQEPGKCDTRFDIALPPTEFFETTAPVGTFNYRHSMTGKRGVFGHPYGMVTTMEPWGEATKFWKEYGMV